MAGSPSQDCIRHYAGAGDRKSQSSMKKILFGAAMLAASFAAVAPASADLRDLRDLVGAARPLRPLTIAVIGDWPYGNLLFDNAARLIDSVNADPKVSRVIHVGDIHSGSQPCTSAGILPPLATSIPTYNQSVYGLFQRFEAPFVYTPGDNEWTDCHKAKEKAAGAPLKELASVRGLFFAKPGRTLGLDEDAVESQALSFDPAYPSDAQFVENVMWDESHVVFVTLNLPGSNDDTVPWTGTFADPVAQAAERTDRDGANQRWLTAAFIRARQTQAKAIVVSVQADMFDPEAFAPDGDGLSAYTPYVQQLARLSLAFGRPVLLINGDSHVYGADRPLADPSSATGLIHGAPAVPNLQRITVEGSTTAPAEWLRLTIDPRTKEVFSYSNVAYCKDPLTSCQ